VTSTPRVRRLTTLALLAAYGTALNLLEAPLPRILPWAKPGLANSAALLTLLLFGIREAMLVTCVRLLLAGLLLGHLLTPGWLLGASGALVAPLVMAVALSLAPPLGLISVSGLGAAAANAIQLLVASRILVDHGSLLAALPLLVGTALPSGIMVGFLTFKAAELLRRNYPDLSAAPSAPAARSSRAPQGEGGGPRVTPI
jgi:heptaprenyl diphosphate synthase